GVVTTGNERSGFLVPPPACWIAQSTPVGGCLMHAAQCPGAFSSSGGTISVHAASFAGCWHRGWNTQPDGGFAGEGTSPVSTTRDFFTVGSATGTAESNACVYGINGSRYKSTDDASSTIL